MLYATHVQTESVLHMPLYAEHAKEYVILVLTCMTQILIRIYLWMKMIYLDFSTEHIMAEAYSTLVKPK